MHLLNQKELKIELPSSSRPDFYFKFRDAMSIQITIEDITHSLHLINRYTHIEIAFAQFSGPLEHCSKIREVVMQAVDKVTNDLHMEYNHVNAFACSNDLEKKCYCLVVNKDEFKVKCTDCPMAAPITDDNSYKCWFKSSTTVPQNTNLVVSPLKNQEEKTDKTSSSSEKTQVSQSTLTIENLNEVLNYLKKNGNISWHSLGLELGSYNRTLNDIESNNPGAEDRISQCISKWFQRVDDVDKYGGANWITLCNAIEKIDPAVANDIRRRHRVLPSQPTEQSNAEPDPQKYAEPNMQITGTQLSIEANTLYSRF
uniref:Death domain-containing protein n=1 Tax=Amphimedon queenslandica TaxID=400682 RepID=A0A1X7U5C4_AMPQE